MKRLMWAGPIGVVVLASGLIGCGRDAASGPDVGGRPTIVVTTSILGDAVGNIVGDDADVVTVMPVGVSPHDFQASARQVNQIREADALIVNGAGFEGGLADVIAGAEADGVPTFEAISAIRPLSASEESGRGHEAGHAEDGDTDHDHDHDHDPTGVDPHFFTDPLRMSDAVDGITDFLVDAVPSIDADRLAARSELHRSDLADLDHEIDRLLSGVGQEHRVLVTNHEVFSYFADRYAFDVIGTIIPGMSSSGAASAGQLAALAELIEREDVPAIFADTSSAARLAETLAEEVGDIDVVELFSESLGQPGSGGETYLEMMRTNAERIADALG